MKIKIINFSIFLVSLGFAMDAPEEQPLQLSRSSQRASGQLEKQQFLDKTYVSDQEWEQMYSLMEDFFAAPYISLNPVATILARQDLKRTREYFDLYKKLYNCLSVNRMPDVSSKELVAKLGVFTLSFELLFLSMREIGNRESVGETSRMHNALFPMVQKTYNTYMWAYEKLINRPLSTFGDLNFFQPEVSIPKNLPKAYLNQFPELTHSNNNAYLFYMCDENGYVLFNLKTRNKIDTNLYYTPVTYQLGDQPTSSCFVFSITSSNRACIIENKGWILNKEKNKYSLFFYNGNRGKKPFTVGQGIFFFDSRVTDPLDKKIAIIKSIDQQIINMVRSLKDTTNADERKKLLATINRLQEQQRKSFAGS